MGLRFTGICTKPLEVLNLTSLTLDEISLLTPRFEAEFLAYMAQWRLDGRERTARRYTTYVNCPLPTPEDRLVFILVYLKNQSLQVLHGRLFDLPQCKANQWIHVLLPVLRATLIGLGDAPSRSVRDLAARLKISPAEAEWIADAATEAGEAESAAQAAPLFVMTAPNAASVARPMRLNKRNITAARRNATR
jgi:hypothetical protein